MESTTSIQKCKQYFVTFILNFLINFEFRPKEIEFNTKVFLHGRDNFWYTTLKSDGISVEPFTRNEIQVINVHED